MNAAAVVYWMLGAAAGAGGAMTVRARRGDVPAVEKKGAVAWVVALGAAGCIAVGVAGGVFAGGLWRTAMVVVCVLWGSAVVAGDVQRRWVDLWVNHTAIVSVCAVMAAAAVANTTQWDQMATAAAAGAAWGLAMEALSIWKPDSVGGADARTGAWSVAVAVWSLGLGDAMAALLVVHLVAAGTAVARRRRSAPFAAWLAALAAVCAIAGAEATL